MLRPLLTLFFLAGSMHGATIALIQNGGFESGNLVGWTGITQAFGDTTGSCNNPFAAQSTGAGCIGGGAPSGSIYAAYNSAGFPSGQANTFGEWLNSLEQTVLVPEVLTQAVISWRDEATWSGSAATKGFGVGIRLLDQNGNFLANQFTLVNPPTNGSRPWTTSNWDITSFLLPRQGKNVRVSLTTYVFYDTRGGAPASSSQISGIAAFDDVSLLATYTAPEPGTFGIALAGLLGVWARMRIKEK